MVAEALTDPDARPRAVYAGKRVVGFLMYDVQKTKGKAQEASIYRFMIDRKHLGKGYGRAALSKALEEILSIRHMPKNSVSKPLSTSFGFLEVRGPAMAR